MADFKVARQADLSKFFDEPAWKELLQKLTLVAAGENSKATDASMSMSDSELQVNIGGASAALTLNVKWKD